MHLPRSFTAKDVAMADFRDPQSDEESCESDGSLDDNIIGPLGEHRDP